jgi:ketosteroid isomerase-like protein
VLEAVHAEVEWYAALEMLLGGEAAVYRGHEGVRELFGGFDDAFAEFHFEYWEIRDLGDRILAIGRIRGRGREGGVEVESPLGVVADYRDGKAIRVLSFLDPEEALEAAGLRE